MVANPPARLSAQIIGNIGLFHVCYELSRRGLNVVPTSRNTRAVDVIVGSSDFSKKATIQVKATTINMGIHIGTRQKFPKWDDVLRETSLADFWVYVRLDAEDGHAVKRVSVWKGGDMELVRKMRKHWWFDPWNRAKTIDSDVIEKWERQTDEGGWRLIMDWFKERR